MLGQLPSARASNYMQPSLWPDTASALLDGAVLLGRKHGRSRLGLGKCFIGLVNHALTTILWPFFVSKARVGGSFTKPMRHWPNSSHDSRDFKGAAERRRRQSSSQIKAS